MMILQQVTYWHAGCTHLVETTWLALMMLLLEKDMAYILPDAIFVDLFVVISAKRAVGDAGFAQPVDENKVKPSLFIDQAWNVSEWMRL